MPDSRKHRSAAPGDAELFAAGRVPELARATAQLSWLLDRGYAESSALQLVGNRFDLRDRQRQALRRTACSADYARAIEGRRLAPPQLAGAALAIDGYNVLTTLEVALGGGVVVLGRDGCARDLAGLHGTWRRVAETTPAVCAIGERLAALGVERVTWYLESAVSNSGRLRALLRDAAEEHGWCQDVVLVPDADPVLVACDDPVASADRGVLGAGGPWFNLARDVIEVAAPGAWVVDLSAGEA